MGSSLPLGRTVSNNSVSVDLNNLSTGLGDAFGRMRVSNPVTAFESSFQYDLQPLIYEQIITGTGAVTHDATNSVAVLSLAGAGSAAMQSYNYSKYQPGKSQLVLISFNFRAGTATKRIGIFDSTNGFFLEKAGESITLNRRSSTAVGNTSVTQASWNLDPLNGTGQSGITLDFTKTQLLVIDAQWLGVGRVRVGFAIGGDVYYCHEFLHANVETVPYTKTFTLPIRAEISTSTTATDNMYFSCASISSEGGLERVNAKAFTQEGTATAGSGARAHLLSLQPKTTFNSIANRTNFTIHEINILVTGANPVYWELVLGQAISGTTTFIDENTTHSGFEYNTAGTISGSPTIVIASGYAFAGNQVKSAITQSIDNYYPITLKADGTLRSDNMGRMSLLVTGIGGTSACRGALTWHEVI